MDAGSGGENLGEPFGERFRNELNRAKGEYEEWIRKERAHQKTIGGEHYYPTLDTSTERLFDPSESGNFAGIEGKPEEGHLPFERFVNEAKKDHFVVFVDAMGQGTGSELADHIFAISLFDYKKTVSNVDPVADDCLDEKFARDFCAKLRKFLDTHSTPDKKAVLLTVFFRPLRGIAAYRHNLYALTQMFAGLRALYEMLPSGGRIYFQGPSTEVVKIFEDMLREHVAKLVPREKQQETMQNMFRHRLVNATQILLVKDENIPTLPSGYSRKTMEQLLAHCEEKKREKRRGGDFAHEAQEQA